MRNATGTQRLFLTGLALTLGLFVVSDAVASPHIMSVKPASGKRGKTLNVVLRGHGFVQGAQVSFGPGITVNSAVVSRPDDGPVPQVDHILTCGITISRTATTGKRSVSVTNPDQSSNSKMNAFKVEK